jgi:hypothetical protein
MTTPLGKIEKPLAENFRTGKKLCFVPLVFSNENAPREYREKIKTYWEQVSQQLQKLENQLGAVKHIYYESIMQSGEEGLNAIKKVNPDSYQLVKDRYEKEAKIEDFEDKDLLEENIDWERCIFSGLISEKAAKIVTQYYSEASKKRLEYLSKKITETLLNDEVGLLLIHEGHQLQFDDSIEIFSVFPPALDELHRWLRESSKRTEKENNEGNG